MLQCEWEACTYVASKMEEFCEHVAQHLQQHLPGDHRDEMDPLGKEPAASTAGAREPSLCSHILPCEKTFPCLSVTACCRMNLINKQLWCLSAGT